MLCDLVNSNVMINFNLSLGLWPTITSHNFVIASIQKILHNSHKIRLRHISHLGRNLIQFGIALLCHLGVESVDRNGREHQVAICTLNCACRPHGEQMTGNGKSDCPTTQEPIYRC